MGHTGAGKTTIINLLLRFYDVERGRITVDGVDVRDIAQQELRGLIGLVQQDVFLFTGDLASNIRLGAPLSAAAVEAAARRVGAHRFIERLPGRYEHRLGERGQNVSVGERQLLAFARALAVDPAILVLDEATSSVDAEAEEQIQAAITELMQGRTSIVIAHRLSTVQHADTILVLHHGRDPRAREPPGAGGGGRPVRAVLPAAAGRGPGRRAVLACACLPRRWAAATFFGINRTRRTEWRSSSTKGSGSSFRPARCWWGRIPPASFV